MLPATRDAPAGQPGGGAQIDETTIDTDRTREVRQCQRNALPEFPAETGPPECSGDRCRLMVAMATNATPADRTAALGIHQRTADERDAVALENIAGALDDVRTAARTAHEPADLRGWLRIAALASCTELAMRGAVADTNPELGARPDLFDPVAGDIIRHANPWGTGLHDYAELLEDLAARVEVADLTRGEARELAGACASVAGIDPGRALALVGLYLGDGPEFDAGWIHL